MKTNSTLIHSFKWLSLGVMALLATSQAGTIAWGGGQLSSNYSSDGTDLELGSSGSVTFELGIFQDTSTGVGFTPTFSNADDWAANWVPFGSAPGSLSDYLTPVAGRATAANENYFTGSLSTGTGTGAVQTFPFASNPNFATNVTQERQVYIWGYNNKTPSLTTEWILFTGSDGGSDTSSDNWVVPSQASANDTFEVQWDVASANTAIVGDIPGSMGAGPNTDEMLTGISDIQFAVVPEPSSMLLILLGASSFWLRRR